MTKGEVDSLQALAKAGGGSLTINPDTGLAEAGFLEKMLPMIVGAGITAATGGAAAPWMIGLGAGGIETLRTGSLSKGLMAGLGAYGGAGLAGGLVGAGSAAAGAAGTGPSAAVLDAGLAGPGATPGIQAGLSEMGRGVTSLGSEAGRSGFMNAVGGAKGLMRYGATAAAPMLMGEEAAPPAKKTDAPVTPLQYRANPINPTPQADVPAYGGLNQDFGRQQRYFDQQFIPVGQMQTATAMPAMAMGGPVEQMSMMNSPYIQGIESGGNVAGYAGGGISHLGDYSDGGRLLKGPGDGVSDSIPAMIGRKQPARLADGEFVVPARIVSELGNGSTEAGARKLYAMMDRVQKARGKTVGKGKVAVNSRAEKMLPA
jgi:hypothetical protein